jgi:hypothetical protein
VAEFTFTVVAALPVLFLWMTLVSLLVRPFGVRLPLSPFSFSERKTAFRALTFSEHLIIGGILYFGCGMFVVTTLSRYLEWKYFHGSLDSLTTGGLLRGFVSYPLIGGLLFGLISWNGRSSTNVIAIFLPVQLSQSGDFTH